MIQIDYEITIFYKENFPKISLRGITPNPLARGAPLILSPPLDPLDDSSGGKYPHTPHVKKWDPSTIETNL
jgi:hypothetical protein